MNIIRNFNEIIDCHKRKFDVVGIIIENKLDKSKEFRAKSIFLAMKKNKQLALGFILVFFILLLALFIPLGSQDPYHIDVNQKNVPAFSKGHILGTDTLGRDLWARLWYGIRYSFGIAVSTTLINIVIGIILGLFSGYNDKFRALLKYVVLVLTNVPSILVLIVICIITTPSFGIIILALTFNGWTAMSQQVSAQILRARNNDWVTASKILNTPKIKIVTSLLPVAMPIILTQLVFTIPTAIIAEAGLGFIGLSIPGEATLGNLLSDGQNLVSVFPRLILVPAIAITIITLSIQLVSNGIQNVKKGYK